MLRGHKIETRPVEWLCPAQFGEHFPAGMITLVASRPGTGKSTLMNYLVAEVTRQGHAVILSNQEDALREILVPRLIAAGADMKRVFLPEQPIMLPAELGELERKIKQVRAKLVVLDAAAQHLSVSIFNDQEVRKALTPLQKVLERTGCACVMVTHTRKNVGKGAHALESIGGAGGGMVGAARAVYVYGPDPKDPEARILAPAKTNLDPPIETGIEFTGKIVEWKVAREKGGSITHKVIKLQAVSRHSTVSATSVIQFAGARKHDAVEEATNPTRLAMAEEWLTGLLKDGPIKVADIEAKGKEIKLSWATIRRARGELTLDKSRHGYGTNGYWEWDLPAEHPLRKARPTAEAETDLDAELAKLLAGKGGAA